ncbi:MAG: N-6 DNA methylase [Desulfosalsimonadaceae bacterium]
MPLEFISCIYEEFVTHRENGESGIGEHYTRPFLVDFMLDKVLPWSGKDHNLRILDPCCGSSVFLVKAFQRLVNRWRNANPGKEPPATLLRELLEKNIFGVDIDATRNAIRVSSFSLYLAMCDEIDPKHYWTQVRFPPLRDVTLKTADFFAEDIPEINTKNDKHKYDLIIGNAPWGKQSLTAVARQWANENGIKPVDKQAGTLFLAKAAKLCKPTGHICMIQPAGSLLFNVSPTALEFRKKLFSDYKVDEIVNLSAIRFLNIFPEAVGPACVIRMRPIPPDGEPIAYWSPKQTHTDEEQYRIVIDAQDLNWVWPEEAADEPVVWPALMWGGRRDFELIMRIRSNHEFISWGATEGFIRGEKNAKPDSDRLDYPILENNELFQDLHIVTDLTPFPINKNDMFERKRNLAIFELPALLMRESWKVKDGRFKAIIVTPNNEKHLLYSQSFMGIKANERALAIYAIAANSSFAVYYYYLTSGRLASYRPSLRKGDLERLPFPKSSKYTCTQLSNMSLDEIDRISFRLYGINEVEQGLVDDFLLISLCDFKSKAYEISNGYKELQFCTNKDNGGITQYCEWFVKVLKSGFGQEKSICASIFLPASGANFPFCLVGIHLDWPGQETIRYERIGNDDLLSRIAELDRAFQSRAGSNETVFYRKVSRIYQTIQVSVKGEERHVQTVFLIKPNQVRYWTRSAALRDADEVAFDFIQWSDPDAVGTGLH